MALAMTLKMGEEIIIGDNIVVKMIKKNGARVVVGVMAPPEINIAHIKTEKGNEKKIKKREGLS